MGLRLTEGIEPAEFHAMSGRDIDPGRVCLAHRRWHGRIYPARPHLGQRGRFSGARRGGRRSRRLSKIALPSRRNQDRLKGRRPWPHCRLPDGRGRHLPKPVRRHPAADRGTAPSRRAVDDLATSSSPDQGARRKRFRDNQSGRCPKDGRRAGAGMVYVRGWGADRINKEPRWRDQW